jgi:hypothetical protein
LAVRLGNSAAAPTTPTAMMAMIGKPPGHGDDDYFGKIRDGNA